MAMSFNFSLTTKSHGLIANDENDLNMVSTNDNENVSSGLLSSPSNDNIDGFAGKDAFGTFTEDVVFDSSETAGSVAFDTSETAGSVAYDSSETAGSIASCDCGGGSSDASFSSFC